MSADYMKVWVCRIQDTEDNQIIHVFRFQLDAYRWRRECESALERLVKLNDIACLAISKIDRELAEKEIDKIGEKYGIWDESSAFEIEMCELK